MAFKVIARPGCGFCDKAKALLAQRGLDYDEDVRQSADEIGAFKAAGYRTFPQIFDGDIHVGGFDGLQVHLGSADDDF